jgi:hypothetical protein
MRIKTKLNLFVMRIKARGKETMMRIKTEMSLFMQYQLNTNENLQCA